MYSIPLYIWSSALGKYIEETNKQKTLHNIQISVHSWQESAVFDTLYPKIIVPTFHNKNGEIKFTDPTIPSHSTTLSQTPSSSPETTPRDKGKWKETNNDSKADDIYKENPLSETIIWPKKPSLVIDTEMRSLISSNKKNKDPNESDPKETIEATIKKPLSGSFTRLAEIQEAIQLYNSQSSSTCPLLAERKTQALLWSEYLQA